MRILISSRCPLKEQFEASVIGVIVYEGVEPIDVGGTVGVISMATRILPELRYAVIAERKGPVRLASGLTILADSDFESAPDCDTFIVTGGPGWVEQVRNPAMLDFLARRSPSALASVCTGALILAASGRLAKTTATTRRHAVGSETQAPIDILTGGGRVRAVHPAAIVDDHGTITSGGVSLAIDGTLYILGRLYGNAIRDQIASTIEYDRAFAANREALGHIRSRDLLPD
jgi:transcriptional regulator GlxA family with amidase domain